MARENLKAARKAAGLTQKEVAARLEMGERNYIYIESGQIMGKIDLWDRLEDMFNIPQRILRENHPSQADNQSKR